MGSRPERRLDRMYRTKRKRLAGTTQHRGTFQLRIASCGSQIADCGLGRLTRPHPQPLSHPMGEGGAWPGFSSPEDRSPRRVRNAEWGLEMEETVLRAGTGAQWRADG